MEDVKAEKADNTDDIQDIINRGNIAVIADAEGECIRKLKPYFLIDAVLAKKNLGTSIEDAPVVIGVAQALPPVLTAMLLLKPKGDTILAGLY